MTTILSTTAVALLAERHVREAQQPVPVRALLDVLGQVDIDRERAEAGVRRALECGRLHSVESAQGPSVRVTADQFERATA